MSTKIYNGYKLKGGPKTLKETRDIIFKFKEKAIDYYRDKYYKLLAKDIVNLFDNAMFAKKVFHEIPHRFDDKKKVNFFDLDPELSIWGMMSNSVDRMSELSKKSLQRGNEYDQYEFYCNITVLPCNDEVFLMIFTEEREIEKMFAAMEEIMPYPYWDNTDQPEGMTWKQWEKIGEEWDAALPTGVPSEDGFGIDILNKVLYIKLYPRDRDDIDNNPYLKTLKHMPDIKDRIERLVRMSVYKAFELDKKNEIDEINNSNIGSYAKWEKKDKLHKLWYKEHQDLVIANREDIEARIKKEFTVDDIKMTVKNFIDEFGLTREEPSESNISDIE